MNPSLYLFDDSVADGFDPFALSRPVGELLFGALLLRERAERYWALPCSGHLARPALRGFAEEGAPPVRTGSEVEQDAVRILQCSRAALGGSPPPLSQEASTIFLDDAVVGWILPAGSPMPDLELLRHPRSLPGSVRVEVKGRLLASPWDLMQRNGDQLRGDIPRF
jgi:hypothetical protein